jgi:hypothetical protein
MAQRDSGGDLSRVYEGAPVLEALLAAVGAPHPAEAVKALFKEAQLAGALPSEVFPGLFEAEPKFASPEAARRLYGNLFGLWDRIAAGQLDEPRSRSEKAAPPPPIPPPPEVEGALIPDGFVQAALGALTTLPEKERTRQRDRFEQRESELCDAIRQMNLSPGAEQAGLDLAFEVWLLCGWSLGARAGRCDFSALQKPTPQGSQPALDRFIAEWLGEAELDEEEPLSASERQKLEPLLRMAAEQLAPLSPVGR